MSPLRPLDVASAFGRPRWQDVEPDALRLTGRLDVGLQRAGPIGWDGLRGNGCARYDLGEEGVSARSFPCLLPPLSYTELSQITFLSAVSV